MAGCHVSGDVRATLRRVQVQTSQQRRDADGRADLQRGLLGARRFLDLWRRAGAHALMGK